MKLWIVIYFAGVIGGTVGPIPYGEEICRARVAELYDQLKPDVTTPDGFTKRDVEFRCEWHQERPENAKGLPRR